MPQPPIPYDGEHLRSLLDGARGFALYRVAVVPGAPFGGEVVLTSPSIREVLGIADARDFASWFATVHYEDLPRVLAANRRSVLTGAPFDEVFRIRHAPEQRVRWVHVMSRPVLERETGPTRYFDGVIVDISAFVEAVRREREPIAAVDGAPEVAHDFNNLLTIVLGNLDLARDQLAGDHGARHHLDEIERAAQRAVAVTRRMARGSEVLLSPPVGRRPAGSSATVLVADDQPALRAVTTGMLQRAGYRVLTAADGHEAVSAFAAATAPIAAVVLDVAMPGQTGPDALLAIRKLRPSQPAVLVSADQHNPRVTALLDAATAFVGKPFRSTDLMATLQSVIDGTASVPAPADAVTASTASRTPPLR